MSFQDAVDKCCECKDDGTAELKQPFLHSFLDARAADFRKPMVGAVDLESETTDDGGIKVTQVTYPLEYECIGGKPPTKVPDPISPLTGNTTTTEQKNPPTSR